MSQQVPWRLTAAWAPGNTDRLGSCKRRPPHHRVNSRVPRWHNSKQVREFYFKTPSSPCFYLNFLQMQRWPFLWSVYIVSPLFPFLAFCVVFAFFFFLAQSLFTWGRWDLFSISRGVISSCNRRLPLGLLTRQLGVWHLFVVLSYAVHSWFREIRKRMMFQTQQLLSCYPAPCVFTEILSEMGALSCLQVWRLAGKSIEVT